MLLKDRNDLQLIAHEAVDFSGADLSAILRSAALVSLEANDMKASAITIQDLKQALNKVMESKKNLQDSNEKHKEKETNYIR
jgi:ATP-dependent 26S proteasome regulatory subunit